MTKKKIILSVIALALLSFGVIKYYTNSATPKPTGVWVQASKVKETTLPSEAFATGTLVARSVEITPEVAGHVVKIHFKDGTFVHRNDALVQLDDAVFKAQYQSAKAQLAYSENDYKRKLLLGKRGAIAQQAIDQAEADVKEKRAIAEEKEVMLKKMLLTAPFDGTVSKSEVNLGDYVTMGKRVVTLTDTKHLRVEYNVAEKYLPSLKLGQTVNITTAAHASKVFSGAVSYLSPTINTENRSVSLYADIANDDNLLASGMFVNVTQLLGKNERALMIPARSLIPILDGEQVYKIVDGKAYAVTILIGKREKDDVQVIQGLSPDDVVITDGQLKVKNSMPVNVKL
jgi:membrane fusion protein, multidrug efflux system